MAVDTPLIRDGGLMTAGANFNSGSLAGPGGTGQFLAVVISASKVVSIASSPTAGPIYGVLQNTPISGEPCDIGILGATKMVSGAGITAGAELMVDSSGRFVTWSAGAANFKVGMCLETVSAINNVFTGMVYMPSYKVVT
jgi:hypothetical protein